MEENNNNESQVKETVKREGKKLAKKLLKPFMKYIIIAAICLFGILLTVGLFYAIRVRIQNLFNDLINIFNDENPDKVTSGNNSSVIYIDEDTGYYKLKDDFSKKILQDLEDNKVNTEFMGFTDALEDQEAGGAGELTEETAKELQDMIDKYIKAEVQTTFPYTGNTWWWQNDNEIDGKIRIKRAFAEEGGRTIDLDYVKYDRFCSMVENNNTNVLNKFSINPENFKLCIAKKGTTTTYYKNGARIGGTEERITKEELNYQTYLQNYSVPLNFFITLHVISEDKAFMEEFVEMVTGGDDPEPIVLTYVETEQQSTTLYNYTGNAEKSITFTEVDEDTVLDENSIRTIYTEQEVEGMGGTEYIDITNANIHQYYSGAPGYDKQVTISKSGRLYITKADTWLKKSEKQVSAMETEDNGGQTQENYPIENLPKELYNYTDWIKKDEETEIITKIMNSKLTIYSLKEIIETSSLTRKYTVTDINSEIAVQEFIDLIESYPKVRNNIQTSPSNIFYLLQQQENTQRLEKIMRYVCYRLNDVDYGVTEDDLNYLLADTMLSAGGGILGGNIQEKLWFTLTSKGYSKEATAGIMGNLHVESGLMSNNLQNVYEAGGSHEIAPGYTDETYTAAVDDGSYTNFVHDAAGYGLAQWTYWSRKEGLYHFAQSQGVSISDENMQIEYLLGEMGNSEYASGYASTITRTDAEWTKATTPEEAAEAFCWAYENPAAYSMSREIRARYYYDLYKDLEAGGNFVSDPSDPRVVGRFTSGLTGRTFIIFNQNNISGWGDRCNRAAQISVCSGYLNKSVDDWISTANAAPDNSMPVYQPIYDPCGLTSAYQSTGSSFDTQKIKDQIQSGGYVVMYLKGNKVGHSGRSKNRKKMG